ncbi:hypothetical protein ACIBKY_51145 [Nonomuraea sp. NPDC050394]|uniref:hypothetical protein n=1 Tax=Nonomuraea sp. NPDC050394 TaxID=3364363 RepID=UPI003798143A
MSEQPFLTAGQKRHLGALLADILRNYPISEDLATHVLANFDAAVDAWAAPDLLTLVYTGSRGARRGRVVEDLADLYERENGIFRLLVGYGPDKREPRGGDRHAFEWAAVASGIAVECFPARWDIPELEKAAGPYRNGFMVGLALGRGGRTGMLAHLKDDSTGSAGAAAFAHSAGMPVWRRRG